MKTKVYLDLDKSTYKVLYKGLIFYFSSELYKKKFEKNINEFIKTESLKITCKYKLSINLELFFAISYYKQIEKRGFKVIDDINKTEIGKELLMSNCIIHY